MEFTNKQIEEIQSLITALREQSAKFNQDAIVKEVTDRVTQELSAKLHPQTEQKMIFDVKASKEVNNLLSIGADGSSEYGKRFSSIGDLVNKCLSHSSELIKVKTMTEGTGSAGGYLVPVEQATEIIKLLTNESVLVSLARNIPMRSKTRTFPSQTGGVTVTWTDEHTFKTPSQPSFGQLTQTAKTLAVVVKLTDDLIEDETAGVQQFLREIIAEAIGNEIDRVGFVGNAGGTDPFNGILYASGVHAVTMAGGSLIGDDIIDLIQSVPAKARMKGTLVTSTMGETLLFKLKDMNGQYIWSAPSNGAPARVWGKPYLVSDNIPTNLNGGTYTAMFFGDYKSFFYSPRNAMSLYVSKDASDWVGGALESAFMQDETWSRWSQRMSLDVSNGDAFGKMYVK